MNTWTYVEPLKDEWSVETFEADYGVTFPGSYKDLVLQFNNGYPSLDMFKLPSGESCNFKHLYSLNRGDVENIWDANSTGTIKAGYVAFGNDAFGNQLGFRMTDNAIVFADLDTDSIVVVAKDFSSFLAMLERGEQQGVYPQSC